MNTAPNHIHLSCRRATQYLITIIIVLVVGYSIGALPIMADLRFADKLAASDVILFITKLTAVILFYQFAIHSLAALPDNGAACSFFRNIGKPLTALVIVIVAQNILWQVIDPFVEATGKTVYVAIAITLIVALAIWLIFQGYQDAPYLVETVKHLKKSLPLEKFGLSQACPGCGKLEAKSALFCSDCGYKLSEQQKCKQCGVTLSANQKYCWQCGCNVNGEDKATEFADGQ